MRWVPVPAELLNDMIHEATFEAPATDREALLEVSYMLTCERFYWTERKMCDRWRWSRGKVRRLIEKYERLTARDQDSITNRSGFDHAPDADRSTEARRAGKNDGLTDHICASDRSQDETESSLARGSSSYILTDLHPTDHISHTQDQKKPPNPPSGVEEPQPARGELVKAQGTHPVPSKPGPTSRASKPTTPKPEPPQIEDRWKVHEHSRMLAGLWYGTECARRDGGPDASIFGAVIETFLAFCQAHRRPVVMDRAGYNPVRAAVVAWMASGQSLDGLLRAARAPADDWLEERGGFTFRTVFGSVDGIGRALSRANGRSASRVPSMPSSETHTYNRLGGIQSSRAEILKHVPKGRRFDREDDE